MCSDDRGKWRKKRIGEMSTNGSIEIALKQSVDVINSVIEDLVESIDKSSQSSSRLSLVVTVATVILAIIGAADLCVHFFNVGAK